MCLANENKSLAYDYTFFWLFQIQMKFYKKKMQIEVTILRFAEDEFVSNFLDTHNRIIGIWETVSNKPPRPPPPPFPQQTCLPYKSTPFTLCCHPF